MSKTRRQLTLFIDEPLAKAIEDIRKTFNPKQYALIKSHVTLCREDEIEEIGKVIQNLYNLNHNYVTIAFGSAIRFAQAKGVLIPAKSDNEQFHQLRSIVLQGIIDSPRQHDPHITLIHPRNGICTDSIFEEIKKTKLPTKLIFKEISLIEQTEGQAWRILKTFALKG